MKYLVMSACLLGVCGAHAVHAADRLPVAPAGSFSIVVIPDTQAYRRVKPASGAEDSTEIANPIFAGHVNWIASNLEKQNIAFVSHVGDIVDRNETAQWEVARACMDVIHGKVPYGISVGNHDMTGKGDSTLFQKYFPMDRYTEFDWYGGAYEGGPLAPAVSSNNTNSYQLFSAGGMDFLFLHLECNAPDDVLSWANDVLNKHRDRRAFITSHMGWGPLHHPREEAEFRTGEKGRMQWVKIHGKRGNSPQQMWEKCYRHHANLIAVFSGDQSRSQALRAATPGEQGNVIHEFLQDYMRETARNGWLRLYRFQPGQNLVQVYTFDPVTEELCEGTTLLSDRDSHQFSFTTELISAAE
ncbi:MAG: metallophosphoesterase [Planctomycetaceae bacterium]|nr:metallophosphoesterase [Planctomycetaceae bacterium]